MDSSRSAARIVISYRRDDSAGHAGRLRDYLVAWFGNGAVFTDVDDIRPGRDFPKAVDKAIRECDVLLALVGPRWLTAASGGGRRLDDPDDYVRRELELALRRKVVIVPVLLREAAMPTAAQLPRSLQALATRQSVRVSDDRWKSDVKALGSALDRILGDGKAGPSGQKSGAAPSGLVRLANGQMSFDATVSRVAEALRPFGPAARVIAETAACTTEYRRLSALGQQIDAQHTYNLAALRSRGEAVHTMLDVTRRQLDASDQQARASQRALENVRRDLAGAGRGHREYLLEVYRIGSAELARRFAAQGDQLSRQFDDILNGAGALAVAPRPLPDVPPRPGRRSRRG